MNIFEMIFIFLIAQTPSNEPPVQVNLIDWMRDNDLNADTCFDGEYVETDTKLLRPWYVGLCFCFLNLV
jgi:hypothetical protein